MSRCLEHNHFAASCDQMAQNLGSSSSDMSNVTILLCLQNDLNSFFSQVAINDYLAYFSFSLLSCQSEKVEEVLKALCLITSSLTTICLLTFVRTSFSSSASRQVPISCTLTGTHKFTSLLWNFYRRKFISRNCK